jgi:hypothetical protein
MRTYSLFGGVLASELPFPELDATSGIADWSFSRGPAPDSAPGEEIGREEPEPGITLRVSRIPTGVRVEMTRLGTFEVNDATREITWAAGEHDCESCARTLVIGRVLPLAMHLAGTLTLHGSAVTIGGRGVTFLAPKHSGKSTLARALFNAGACLASDDCVPVSPGSPARMYPGVHQLRLRSDSASHFLPDPDSMAELMGGKYVLDKPQRERRLATAAPLGAVYVLEPVAPGPGVPAVRRHPLPLMRGTMALVQHAKIRELLRMAEAQVLQQAAAIATAIPIYTLEVVRDYARLPEVVDTLLAWHGAPEKVGVGA